MFCNALPCECDGAPKKKVSKSSKSRTINNVQLPDTSALVSTSSVPTTDIHAAMKATMTGTAQVAPQVGFGVRTKTERIEDVDPEVAQCLNTLYPILHEDEKRKHKNLFDKPESRAQRWRESHGNDS